MLCKKLFISSVRWTFAFKHYYYRFLLDKNLLNLLLEITRVMEKFPLSNLVMDNPSWIDCCFTISSLYVENLIFYHLIGLVFSLVPRSVLFFQAWFKHYFVKENGVYFLSTMLLDFFGVLDQLYQTSELTIVREFIVGLW